mgnify:CR=1 FL=1
MPQCHCMDFEKDFLSKLAKKYRSNCFGRTEVTIGRSKESSFSVSSAIPRKERHPLEPNGKEMEKSEHSGNDRNVHQSFPIDYDPRRPLGFHSITAVDKADRPHCVISAISSTGVSSRNTVLRRGLKVCAAEILEKEHHRSNIKLPIHNHRQLKLHYHTAKERGAKLRVWFSVGAGEDKTNITPPQPAEHGASYSCGDWWDGGEMLSKQSSQTVSQRVDLQVDSTVDQPPVSALPFPSLPRTEQGHSDTSKNKRVRFIAVNENDAPKQYQMTTSNYCKEREADEAPSMESSRKRQRISTPASSSSANWVATAATPTSRSVLQEKEPNYKRMRIGC